MSLIYLLSALLMGAGITRRLGLNLFHFEVPALSIAFGLLLWTWLSFILALAWPFAYSLPITCIISGAIGLYLLHSSPKWHWRQLPGHRRAWLAWGSFSIIATGVIGRLMWTHDLIAAPDGLYSANATWGDFGMHASLISHFASNPRLPLDFPIAAGTHLTYPFMVDLLSSSYLLGGWSLHLAIVIPGLLLITAFLQLILGFGTRLFGSIAGVITALSLFLLTGSAVGILTAYHDFTASGQTLFAFLGNLPQDYTMPSSPNAQIANVIADIILPQRAFLMGFSTFAAALTLIFRLRQKPNRWLGIFLGVIIGLLPLVHAHSFVVLMALVGCFWFGEALKNTQLAP